MDTFSTVYVCVRVVWCCVVCVCVCALSLSLSLSLFFFLSLSGVLSLVRMYVCFVCTACIYVQVIFERGYVAFPAVCTPLAAYVQNVQA
jgi:hypothetical protein